MMVEKQYRRRPKTASILITFLFISSQGGFTLYAFSFEDYLREEAPYPGEGSPKIASLFLPQVSIQGDGLYRLEREKEDERSEALSFTYEQPILPGPELLHIRAIQKAIAYQNNWEKRRWREERGYELITLFCAIISGRKEIEYLEVMIRYRKLLHEGQTEGLEKGIAKTEELDIAIEELQLRLLLARRKNDMALASWEQVSGRTFPEDNLPSLRILRGVGADAERSRVIPRMMEHDKEYSLLKREAEKLKNEKRLLPRLLPDIDLKTHLLLSPNSSGMIEPQGSWTLSISFSLPGMRAATSMSYGKEGDRALFTSQEGKLLISPIPYQAGSIELVDFRLKEREKEIREKAEKIVLELDHLEEMIPLKEKALHIARKAREKAGHLHQLGKVSSTLLLQREEGETKRVTEYTELLCQRLLLLSHLFITTGDFEEVMKWEL